MKENVRPILPSVYEIQLIVKSYSTANNLSNALVKGQKSRISVNTL